MRTLEGKVVAREIKVGIVAARFNEFIVSKLVAGARDGLLRHDVMRTLILHGFQELLRSR